LKNGINLVIPVSRAAA
jgi:hypothetical protein